jgi:FixJ family two-component response regulator
MGLEQRAMGIDGGATEFSDENVLSHNGRVFLVESDKQLLDSLVALLEAHELQVHAFTRPESFLKFYRREMSGCLVLDVCMPRHNGIEMYAQLLRDGKRLPAIFITAHADVSMAVAAMKSGAIEFLEKPLDRDTLLDRVRKALAIDAKWRREDAHYAAISERIGLLSDRDRETLALIQAGKSNKSIAASLFLTERAVEMRRSTIMRKLQVHSLAELVELATTHRILTEQRHSTDEHRTDPP